MGLFADEYSFARWGGSERRDAHGFRAPGSAARGKSAGGLQKFLRSLLVWAPGASEKSGGTPGRSSWSAPFTLPPLACYKPTSDAIFDAA